MQQSYFHYNSINIFHLLVFFTMFAGPAISQDAPDRMSTNKEDAWVSCTPRQNPNAQRGVSHWIRYDMGMVRQLGKSTFWNLNHPEYLDSGVREFAVDLSNDGITWQHAGNYSLDRAGASGFYNGVQGPDFNKATGRYLLITAISNHGGPCYGFAELRVEAVLATGVEVVDTAKNIGSLEVKPNPANDYLNIEADFPLAGKPYDIVSMSGQPVLSGTYSADAGIAVSNLLPGMYFIRISGREAKFVKM